MTGHQRPRLRVQLLVLVAAAVLSGVGAVIWSNVVTDNDLPDGPDVVLAEPGEYVLPGASPNPAMTGAALPTVALTGADGAVEALRSDGRPMVINLWYSTCAPCARELAEFASVEADVGTAVRFVGINPQDTTATMREFAAERGVDYELWRDPELAFTDALGVVAFPVTLFVDADGHIVGQSGVLDADELRAHLIHHWGVS